MMKYYLDTEFLEGPQKRLFGYTKPTIDLISIAIVAEDGREYYAVSKDFNLKEAWNRWEYFKTQCAVSDGTITRTYKNKKVYWIRENVLKPIYLEKISGDARNHISFSYSGMKWLIKNYGKSNQQIAEEIKEFVGFPDYPKKQQHDYENRTTKIIDGKPEFYGYFADYDWVAFCWLFGRMIDLPEGFPMYCRDLKQMLDEKEQLLGYTDDGTGYSYPFHKHSDYPKQENEHSALHDARHCRDLYNFIK